MVKKSDNRIWKLDRYKYINPIDFVRQLKADIKFSFQRINHGFCDRDWWSADYYIASLFSELFLAMKENGISYARLDKDDIEFINGTFDIENNDCFYENWKLFLQTLSDLCASYCVDSCDTPEYRELAKAEDEYLKKHPEEKKHFFSYINNDEIRPYFDAWSKKTDELEELGIDNIQQALRLIAKNFQAFWD